jgi:hypothetical protein
MKVWVIWNLVIGNYLELGIWLLELSGLRGNEESKVKNPE